MGTKGEDKKGKMTMKVIKCKIKKNIAFKQKRTKGNTMETYTSRIVRCEYLCSK